MGSFVQNRVGHIRFDSHSSNEAPWWIVRAKYVLYHVRRQHRFCIGSKQTAPRGATPVVIIKHRICETNCCSRHLLKYKRAEIETMWHRICTYNMNVGLRHYDIDYRILYNYTAVYGITRSFKQCIISPIRDSEERTRRKHHNNACMKDDSRNVSTRPFLLVICQSHSNMTMQIRIVGHI